MASFASLREDMSLRGLCNPATYTPGPLLADGGQSFRGNMARLGGTPNANEPADPTQAAGKSSPEEAVLAEDKEISVEMSQLEMLVPRRGFCQP
jgi:hypothetical protein